MVKSNSFQIKFVLDIQIHILSRGEHGSNWTGFIFNATGAKILNFNPILSKRDATRLTQCFKLSYIFKVYLKEMKYYIIQNIIYQISFFYCKYTNYSKNSYFLKEYIILN